MLRLSGSARFRRCRPTTVTGALQGPTALTFLPPGPFGGAPDPSTGLLAVAEEHQVGVGMGVQGAGREAGVLGHGVWLLVWGKHSVRLILEANGADPRRTGEQGQCA